MKNDSSRLDITVCVDEFHPMGGTEQQVVQLVTALLAREHTVRVLSRWSLHADNRYVEKLRGLGVEMIAPGWIGEGRGRRHRLPMIRRSATERITGQRPGSAAWAWQSRRLAKLAPANSVIHELPFFGVVDLPPARAAYASMPYPVVHTALGRWEGIRAEAVAPWAVVTADGNGSIAGDDVRWIPSMGPELTETADPAGTPVPGRVVFLGRYVEQKGLGVLLDAMVGLPGAELICAGYGPDREALERKASALGVAAEFRESLGRRDVLELLGTAAVTAVPSLNGEGLPSVLAESLAMGTPVVASDVGAMSQVLEPMGSIGGRLCRPNDSKSLRTALAQFMTPNPAARSQVAAYYGKTLSPAVVVDQYEECYREAVGRAANFR